MTLECLKPHGWITIDPLAENIKKKGDTYQYKQDNYFLSFTNGFNIPLKPTVQVLQPLVFVSKKAVKFEDKIELKC